MKKTLREIAQILNGEVVGAPDTLITGVCGIEEAGQGDLAFVANAKYLHLIQHTRASAIITSRDIKSAPKPIIRTDNPSLAFAQVLALFSNHQIRHPKGIHSTAVIEENVSLGKNVSIGAYTVILEGASIGDNTIIYPNCFVGYNTKIGRDCLIYPNVSIRERITIGDRVIVHSGTVIGSDGFGFATVDGVHHKIPQVGTVIIEDDVEIGANVTIDRARFDKTLIGRGTKIDNLVHIAHNVQIGEDSIIVAQVGISGSTKIGKNVTLAGQAGLVGHISIGDGAVVAAQAGVTKSVPPHTTVSGYPAREHNSARRINACIQKLPQLYEKIDLLEKEIKRHKPKSIIRTHRKSRHGKMQNKK